MRLFGYTLVRSAELPFHREVNRLIRDNPEYLDGIRKGIVHVAFNPGQKPKDRDFNQPVVWVTDSDRDKEGV